MRRRIVLQLWASMVALVLLILVVLGLVVNEMLSDFYFLSRVHELENRGLYFARIIDRRPDFIQLLPDIRELVGARVAVYDAARGVVAQSGFDAGDPAAVVAPEKLKVILEGGGFAGPDIMYAGELHYAVVVPIGPLLRPRGIMLLLAPVGPFYQALADLRRVLWIAAGGTVLLSSGLALVLSITLARPLIAMQRATRAIARGDYGVQVPATGQNEVGLLAESINDLSTALARVERNRREFFANISHELRTPLSHIRGYSQALEEGLIEDPEERGRYLRVIRRETDRLSRLVEDLMDLAQLEEGQLPLRLGEVDPAELVADVVGQLSPRAEAAGIALTTRLPAGLPPLRADAARAEQVLVNLIDNALRHTPAGGQVTVAARPVEGALELAVSDNGPGIPAEELPYIWERFHKVEKSRAQVTGEGRGLGLAIVRSIVRAHGGEVAAESELGRGTTIRVTFPVQKS